MAEIQEPKTPPPPKAGTRDDSAGTLLKLAGGCCVTICGCTFGPILFLLSVPFAAYGVGFLAVVSVVCTVLGCFSAKFTWDGMQKASGEN